MVVESRMPGETRFEQLLGDPQYFERAFARARARAEQRLPVAAFRPGAVLVGAAPIERR